MNPTATVPIAVLSALPEVTVTPVPASLPISGYVAPTSVWAVLMPSAGLWSAPPPVPRLVPPTALETLTGGVPVARVQGDTVAGFTAPAVTPFIAPEIRTDASPTAAGRSGHLMLTAAFLGALLLGFVAFLGWRHSRFGWG